MAKSNRFHAEYRYQRPSSPSWSWTTFSGDISMWSGPRGRSETAVVHWLSQRHGGATIMLESLDWEDDDE